MATVLLCSNEPLLAEGLSVLLSQAGDLELVSCCPKADDLCEQLEQHQPDLLLVDLTAEFTFALLSKLRNLVEHTKIILWVHSISTELALQAMSLGVRGVLRKTVPIDMLLRCLSRVNEGELWFEKTLTDSIVSVKRYSLTRREGQLVILLTQGLKNKEIATALSISEGTVKVYLSHLFKKLDVKDRFELALFGLKNLAASAGGMDTTATGPAQNANSAVVHPPRSFFVDRIPLQSNAGERRPSSEFRALS
jgi:DNA-binding NarL/FixJ family response regulator